MNRLFRKLRGVLGIGLTWGELWAAIGLAVALVVGVVDPDSIDPGEEPIIVAGFVGVVGFISGVAFGTILSITAPLGAVFAMASVAIARRAQLHDSPESKLLTDSPR